MIFDCCVSWARIGSVGARDGAKELSGGVTVLIGTGSVVYSAVEASAVDSVFTGGSGRHSSVVQLQLGQTHFRELRTRGKKMFSLTIYA